MTFTKGDYIHGGILLATVILGWLIFRGCDPAPVTDNQKIDSLTRALKSYEIEYNRHIKRDMEYSDKLEKKVDSLKDVLDKEKLNVRITSKELDNVLAGYQKAKEKKDTVDAVTNCDSIVKLATEQALQFEYYIETSDSIYYAELRNRQLKDSIIAEQAKMYAQFRSSFYTVSNDYNKLSEDYNKMVKKRNFNKTTTRILAAAVVVLGGILLTKN